MSVHKVRSYTATNPYPKTTVAATFQPGEPFTLIREVTGAVSADAASSGLFTASDYPASQFGFSCDRYDTVFIGAKFTGSGSITVAPMLLDPDAQVWVDLHLSAGLVQTSEPLDGKGNFLTQLNVLGTHAVFFRIANVIGSVSDLEIFGRPGGGRNHAFFG